MFSQIRDSFAGSGCLMKCCELEERESDLDWTGPNTLPSIAATTTTATAVIIMGANTATAVMGQQIDLVAKKMNQQQAVQEHQNIVLSPFWQNIKQMRSPDNSRQPIMEPSPTVQATTTATAMELSRQELIRTTHSREQRGRQRHQQHRATAFPQHCP